MLNAEDEIHLLFEISKYKETFQIKMHVNTK